MQTYSFNSLLFSWGNIDGMRHVLLRLIKCVPENKKRFMQFCYLTVPCGS